MQRALDHAGPDRGRLQARLAEACGRYVSVLSEALRDLHFPGSEPIGRFAFRENPLHKTSADDSSFAFGFRRLTDNVDDAADAPAEASEMPTA